MSAASPTATGSPAGFQRLVAAVTSRPLWIALAITATMTVLRMAGSVDSDVAWQLWIAGRIHAGANLYRDIIETNPPLWFWMALPIDRIAALLNVRIEAVLVAAIGATSALSLMATDRLIGHITPGRRAALLGYGALVLIAVPWVHLGQREQIALIGTLPYAALIAARRERRQTSSVLAALVGAGAALGFALKQYFLVVPALLELWLFLAAQRTWRPIRPETIAMVTVGAVYAAALLLLERDFITNIVPLIHLAYGSFGAPSLGYMFSPFAVVGLGTLALVASQWRLLAGRSAPFAAALTIAAFGFATAYFMQFKGWPYHAIPLIGCASLALVAAIAESNDPLRHLRLLAPALLALPLFLSVQEERHPMLPNADLREAVSGLKAGDTIGFLATETAVPWSITLQGGYRYASRYNGFWMLPAIMRNEHEGNSKPRLASLGRRIVGETVVDFSCMRPKRIIVARPRPGEAGFDILPFFARDPRFRALLLNYRVTHRTGLETYELTSPLPVPTAPCREGV